MTDARLTLQPVMVTLTGAEPLGLVVMVTSSDLVKIKKFAVIVPGPVIEAMVVADPPFANTMLLMLEVQVTN